MPLFSTIGLSDRTQWQIFDPQSPHCTSIQTVFVSDSAFQCVSAGGSARLVDGRINRRQCHLRRASRRALRATLDKTYKPIPPTISDAMTKVCIAHKTRHRYLMLPQLYLEDNVYRKDDLQAHAVVLVRPPSFFSFNVF